MQNYTWYITDLPPGYKALGSRWIIKQKLNHDGTPGDKYKGKLVVEGFRQKKVLTILTLILK